LLNPFLLILYLLDLVQDVDGATFWRILTRAGLISAGVFIVFALLGQVVFERLLQARFESFQIFGGIVFLLIGIRFVFSGPDAIKAMRGRPEHIAGSIALPIMIGPGTVSASILAGSRLPGLLAVAAIVFSVATTVLCMGLMKKIHDWVRPRNERLIERYVEIMGRIAALVVGTYSIEMIMTGLGRWATHIKI
jgi:multiple antibiotic resistance protein